MTAAAPRSNANRTVAIACTAFAVFMVAAAYASVPLYRLFCQSTGFGGVPKRVENIYVQPTSLPVDVRFDANVSGGLPWTFVSLEHAVHIKIGELTTVHYRITNQSNRPTAGIASYNVTPQQMGSYFSKIQCFCFTQQKLGPNESADLSVTFYVDPAMLKDDEAKAMTTVTLSYSFYPAEAGTAGPIAALERSEAAAAKRPAAVN